MLKETIEGNREITNLWRDGQNEALSLDLAWTHPPRLPGERWTLGWEERVTVACRVLCLGLPGSNTSNAILQRCSLLGKPRHWCEKLDRKLDLKSIGVLRHWFALPSAPSQRKIKRLRFQQQQQHSSSSSSRGGGGDGDGSGGGGGSGGSGGGGFISEGRKGMENNGIIRRRDRDRGRERGSPDEVQKT
ncbi:hypothetical protein PoB_006437600 [Plakobranchus ocellatus]|uniref:Uncharacterized protein n=1 Tax=Plakobranchus ocellatus TaxID=259542 RepID=A0AAV4D0Y5_9GAST|nr:hypothetical protein PoB_006437600 [Plakobranchus ocellatus]